MIFPSFTTILVCFFEMFPLGRQMSFSSTRPMVISSHSKSSRCVAPPFSVRMTMNGIVEAPAGDRVLRERAQSKAQGQKRQTNRIHQPAPREQLNKHRKQQRTIRASENNA